MQYKREVLGGIGKYEVISEKGWISVVFSRVYTNHSGGWSIGLVQAENDLQIPDYANTVYYTMLNGYIVLVIYVPDDAMIADERD